MAVEKRNIGVCILLSIVTCGIYGIYWFYCLANDIYRAAGEPSNATMDLLLGIVTCGIYYIYIYYVYAKKLDTVRAAHGAAIKDDSILFILLAVFGMSLINMCIIQHNMNEEIWPMVQGGNGQYWN